MEMETGTETVNIVLKPKFELLDPNFEGYKLNLGKIPIHSKQIEQGVLQAPESDNSYSYQQVRLHALHNHLWQDSWSTGLNFYFSSPGVLHAVGLDEAPAAACRLKDTAVLQLPAGGTGDGLSGTPVHPSLALVSDRLALVTDGRGELHVTDTGDRRQRQPWQIRFSFTALEGCGFVVTDAVLDPADRLHVLTEHVVERETVPEWRPDAKDVSFVTLLTWLTLTPDEAAGWRLSRLRQAATSGTVHYACLAPAGDSLCAAAERPVTIVRDSERPPAVPAATAPTQQSEPLYHWSQTAEDLTVQLASSVSADGLRVALGPHQLSVVGGGETLLQGELSAAIRRDESTWTVDGGRLELVLAKAERGRPWPELLAGDSRGLQQHPTDDASDTAQGADSKQSPSSEKPGPVVGAEVEDCDDLPEHSTSLLRIDGDTHAATHQASLSGHQYLMTVRLAATEPPAFCIRHDVDGLVWQPRSQEGRYHCEHVGTLQAFGFVQASKQQRKFLACSPDLSYALISETSRHLFIYHQPSPVEGDLRNRRSGQRVREVSRQQVVRLEHQEPILGVTAAAGAVFVLTASQLHALVLSSE